MQSGNRSYDVLIGGGDHPHSIHLFVKAMFSLSPIVFDCFFDSCGGEDGAKGDNDDDDEEEEEEEEEEESVSESYAA